MSERIILSFGDIVSANLHNRGMLEYVVTQTEPPCVDHLTYDVSNGDRKLRPAGTLSGPVEVLGKMSVAEVIDCQGRGWLELDDKLRSELQTLYEEIESKGSIEY